MPAIFGLDLGQQMDFSALAGVERTTQPDGKSAYAVRHLHRWALGTPYPAVVADVEKTLTAAPVAGSPLAVDQTGVGRAVVDLFRASGKLVLEPITITAGHAVTKTEDGWHVAKKELVGCVQALLQSRRLTIASSRPLAATLVKELTSFKVRITAAANEQFGEWRDGAHDDLVLSVALAVWMGENGWYADWIPTVDEKNKSLVQHAPRGVWIDNAGEEDDL